MTGKEKFKLDGQELDFDFTDFWRFQYSNVFNMQEYIAEFLVAQALGVSESQNAGYWTLWDITYRDTKIEIKETSFYHPWNKNGHVSKQRTFGITKANGSYDPTTCGNKEYRRQNDIYVFCLNTGNTPDESYPLNLNNWEFYVIPTSFINEKCGDNKTLSLNRIRNFGFSPLRYDEIKNEIDRIIDTKNNNQT